MLQFAIVGLALAFVVTRMFPERFARVAPAAQATIAAKAAPHSYASAVERASPWVVSVHTQRLVSEPVYGTFGDPLYRKFAGITLVPSRPRLAQGVGSGVIVRADGYVVTNSHVVANASGILVGFPDGRTTAASVVGTDVETDLAVLKIDASNLPAAELIDTDPLAVGDVVLAIGNPYGIGQTVTQGIVSAVGRNNANVSRFEDLIQTDATINFGNSGGALVNAEGRLIGINAAMFGVGQGINFAIPAASARRVLEQIIAHGYVIRGWIGAEYTDTPLNMRGPLVRAGVQLQLVLPGGPADQAGMRPGDVVVRFNGHEIGSEGELRALESALAPGTQVRLEGLRAGVPFQTEMTLIQRGQAATG
ncbi:MAG TPA: trypsin-like peptidase domain-containing protein [Candidatus Saccharimonadia bacterium]|nr:trypsin-like peptidase domain-containing protein [Candidatus Saccharimonadia bacterium]